MNNTVRLIRTTCRECGKEIYMIKTDRGKTLPTDRIQVQFVIGDDSRGRRFITQNGELFRGELAGDGEQEYDKMTGWLCHFETCPMKKR